MIERSYNLKHMGRTLKHPLRAFREANGNLSQEAAADLVGISQAMWSQLETGQKFVSPKVARRIASITGVAETTLMDFGDNDADPVGATTPRKPR